MLKKVYLIPLILVALLIVSFDAKAHVTDPQIHSDVIPDDYAEPYPGYLLYPGYSNGVLGITPKHERWRRYLDRILHNYRLKNIYDIRLYEQSGGKTVSLRQ